MAIHHSQKRRHVINFLILCCSVRITTAQYPVPAVCAKDQIDDWFDRLAECLHWNVRKPQKELSILSSNSSSIENSVVDFGEN